MSKKEFFEGIVPLIPLIGVLVMVIFLARGCEKISQNMCQEYWPYERLCQNGQCWESGPGGFNLTPKTGCRWSGSREWCGTYSIESISKKVRDCN